MAAGALTGNAFAQLLTAFSAGILPYLIVALPVGNLEVVFDVSIWELFPSLRVISRWRAIYRI